MSSTPKVLLNTYKNKAVITLNQPEINYEITRAINNHLHKWQDNNLVLQINTYKPNFISFLDGNVMGSGASLILSSKFRIITERTLLFMPETSIGFIPHAGVSYFLNKLPGCLGLYLLLTGEKLRGQEVVTSGIGTHYVPSDLLPELEKKLMECNDTQDVEVILDCYHRYEIEENNNSLTLEEINFCFNADKMEDILARLSKVGSKFCLGIRDLLMKKSPTSLKITLELWKRSKDLSIIDCLVMEYNVVCKLLNSHVMRNFGHQIKPHSDIKEGMRTVFIEMDNNPKWFPEKLEYVSQLFVDSYFESN